MLRNICLVWNVWTCRKSIQCSKHMMSFLQDEPVRLRCNVETRQSTTLSHYLLIYVLLPQCRCDRTHMAWVESPSCSPMLLLEWASQVTRRTELLALPGEHAPKCDALHRLPRSQQLDLIFLPIALMHNLVKSIPSLKCRRGASNRMPSSSSRINILFAEEIREGCICTAKSPCWTMLDCNDRPISTQTR